EASHLPGDPARAGPALHRGRRAVPGADGLPELGAARGGGVAGGAAAAGGQHRGAGWGVRVGCVGVEPRAAPLRARPGAAPRADAHLVPLHPCPVPARYADRGGGAAQPVGGAVGGGAAHVAHRAHRARAALRPPPLRVDAAGAPGPGAEPLVDGRRRHRRRAPPGAPGHAQLPAGPAAARAQKGRGALGRPLGGWRGPAGAFGVELGVLRRRVLPVPPLAGPPPLEHHRAAGGGQRALVRNRLPLPLPGRRRGTRGGDAGAAGALLPRRRRRGALGGGAAVDDRGGADRRRIGALAGAALRPGTAGPAV
ncbi:MAG: hypothetical protein AVDCRST_MAG68-3134, partial [uncultured Gemmatimonadetes bacterium]